MALCRCCVCVPRPPALKILSGVLHVAFEDYILFLARKSLWIEKLERNVLPNFFPYMLLSVCAEHSNE